VLVAGAGPRKGECRVDFAGEPRPGQVEQQPRGRVRAIAGRRAQRPAEARHLGGLPVEIPGSRRREVLSQQRGKLRELALLAVRAAGVPVQQKVLGERDPVARLHPENLVLAVGVEGHQGPHHRVILF
jgi:hypothetical protein